MKRNILRNVCGIIALLFCLSICAQRNYRPGFIITLKRDTVYGKIDFRTDKMNALRCVFKSEEDAESVTYLPFEIAGYRFTDDGKYYVSRMIKPDEGKEAIPVFLEYLLEGMKSLYYYESKDGRELYFIQDGERLVMLDAPELERMKSEGLIVNGRVDRYVPTLQYVFRDCPELMPKILKTSFSHKGLIKIAKEYHYAVCVANEDCIEFENRTSKRKGMQVLFTPYMGVMQYHFLDVENIQKPDLSYIVGVNLAITNRRWKGAVSGVVDLSLSRLTAIPNPPRNTPEYDFTSMAVSLEMGIRLTYPKGKVRPFLEGGYELFKRLEEDAFNGIYSGEYVGAGVNVKLVRNERQSLVIRTQFEHIRRYVFKKDGFLNAWSAVVGYTF